MEQRCGYLESVGLPAGLAEVLQEQEHTVGMRIYILDNSGSTGTHDGAFLAYSQHSRAHVGVGLRTSFFTALATLLPPTRE